MQLEFGGLDPFDVLIDEGAVGAGNGLVSGAVPVVGSPAAGIAGSEPGADVVAQLSVHISPEKLGPTVSTDAARENDFVAGGGAVVRALLKLGPLTIVEPK